MSGPTPNGPCAAAGSCRPTPTRSGPIPRATGRQRRWQASPQRWSAGDRYTKTYLDMWEDESGCDVETRCKLCPDALGEASDVASADVWPGGSPSGEDEGFNGIVVRTAVGEELVASAVASGDLVLGDPITPRQFDGLQPHQVRRKEALAARCQGLSESSDTCRCRQGRFSPDDRSAVATATFATLEFANSAGCSHGFLLFSRCSVGSS